MPRTRRRVLERYCGSILDRRLDQIRRADVIAIVAPIMAERRATGSRLHGWIRAALAWGVAREHLEFNVAEGIGAALPAARNARKHHAALPYSEVGAALNAIEVYRQRRGEGVSPVHRADCGPVGRGARCHLERNGPASGGVAHTGGAHEGRA